MSTG
ncbi:hypothetical protein VCHC22A1_1001, partial [Vibrio cholerae HC-22A1]|jgi:serine/threonine protein kinase